MNTSSVPPLIDPATDRVIKEKTAYWQQSTPAVNHLNNSGVRPRGVFLPIADKMLSFIPPGSRILDVGCGHGRMSIPMADAGHQVVATDVSAKMLELLDNSKGALPIETRLGDAHRLAADDEEFDVVISYDFMPHFPDWPRLLAEKARACKAGGRIIFAFNFTEHRNFAEPFGGNRFEHSYSCDVQSPKPFWAECTLDVMLDTIEKTGLNLTSIVPLKFLHDNVAFGGTLGTDDYRAFQNELGERLLRDPAAADFFCWLESRLFQRLPFFASYSSLLVMEKSRPASEKTPSTTETSIAGTPSYSTPTPDPAAEMAPHKFLSEIPSETTLEERTLLLNHFQHTWDGQGSIVEIGPFLGGTTRAIAWGMSKNRSLAPDVLLHTFDRFDAYYSAQQLRTTIEPMVRGGIFSATQADDLSQSADFERLFQAIHSPHGYATRIRLHNSPLPDFPEEIARSKSLDLLSGHRDLGALFIDGCKSWASTLYAMKFLLPRTRVGAHVIFQDYGWYTCFWISAFVYALRDILEPREHADSTYAFVLKRAVTEKEIEKRFAKTPDQMGAAFFKECSLHNLKQGVAQNDVRAVLIAQLHFVAALATIGRKSDGLNILNAIQAHEYGPLASMIAGCRKSPTYRPGGKQILWTEE